MGDEVYKLHKKLNGEDWERISTIFMIILTVSLSFGIPFFAFVSTSDSSIIYVAVTAGGILIWLFGIISMLIASLKFQVDVNEFVRAYKRDYSERAEIEILEMAYSDALSHAQEGLKNALTAWLLFGAWVSLTEIGLVSGNLGIKNSSVFWFGIGVASLLSFAGFIFTILLYLRKRSIEKALFAIQLKKSDKAEISIKL